MSKWEEKRLGELCQNIFSGGTPSTSNSDYWNGEFFWLSSGETSNKYIATTSKTITQIGIDNSSTRLAKTKDVVMACAGQGKTRGQTSYLKNDMHINQSVIALRVFEDKLNSKYLLHYLSLKYDELRYLSDASSTRGSITTDMLRKMKITIPDHPTQERIADILSTYDDLIENNNRRIVLLEKAAQDLYKEWFVRFRFPNHENTKFVNGLPEGWEMKKLSQVIEFNPTIRANKDSKFKSIPMAALSTGSMVIDDLPITKLDKLSGSRSANGDTLLARITPCLENGKTGFVQCLTENEIAGGSTEFIVMRSKELNPYIVYCIARSQPFREQAINSMNGADGRQRAKVSLLERLNWMCPPDSLLNLFMRAVEHNFSAIRKLSIQNQNLKKQRDLLLPRLMSGKLEV